MYIVSAEVENYKSFLRSPEICFTSGFNVVLGPNNAGKTALVEALSRRIENIVHRSPNTVPVQGARVQGASQVHLVLQVKVEELRHLLWENWRTFNILKAPNLGDQQQTDKVVAAFLSESINIRMTWQANDLVAARIVEMDSEGNPDLAIQFALDDREGIPVVRHKKCGCRGPQPSCLPSGKVPLEQDLLL